MVEGLISLTLLTSKGVATTKPVLGLVVNNGLALLGGTAIGGLVAYPFTKRWQQQEKERLSQELEQAKAQLEEANGLREKLATAETQISQLLSEAASAADAASATEAAEATEVAEAPFASVEASSASVEASVPDDLKKIKGIGKVFEARLNQAGIYTFADLAKADPEELREIVSSGRVENMIHPEEWIKQAQEWIELGN